MFYRQITQHPTEIGVTRPSPRLANGDRSRGSAKSAASPDIVTWRSSGTCRMGPVMFNRKGPLSNEGVKPTVSGLGICLGHWSVGATETTSASHHLQLALGNCQLRATQHGM